jgi:hypothetical protein
VVVCFVFCVVWVTDPCCLVVLLCSSHAAMNTEDKAEFVQLNAMDKLRYKNDMDAFREEERKKLEQERAKEHRELASASASVSSASSAIASAISVAEHVAHSSISMKTV